MDRIPTVIVLALLIGGGVAVTTSLGSISLDGGASVTVNERFVFVNDQEGAETSITVKRPTPVSVFLSNDSQRASIVAEEIDSESLVIRLSILNRGDSSGTVRVSPQVLVNGTEVSFNLSTQTAQRTTVGNRTLLPTENHTSTGNGDAIVDIATTNDSTARTFLLVIESDRIANNSSLVQLKLNNIEGDGSIVRPDRAEEDPAEGGDDSSGSEPGPPFPGAGNPQPDIDGDSFDELGRDVDGDGSPAVITTLFTGTGDTKFDLVAVDNDTITDISTGGLKIPSNNTDSAAIGPPLDFDGDNELEIPFVAKTSDGSGPFLYVSGADQAIPKRVTEVEGSIKGLRISRGNVDNDSFADILFTRGNNQIVSIDGNDIAPRVLRERGLETIDIGSVNFRDIAKAGENTGGSTVLFAVGGSGTLIRLNETLNEKSVQSTEELTGEPSLAGGSTLTTVTTVRNGTEVWTAGGNGELIVFNRSTSQSTNFASATGGNQISDLVVVSPTPDTRVVLFVDGQQVNNQFPVQRLTITRNNGTYTVSNQSKALVPSKASLKAITVQNNTVFVGGKQQIYSITGLGTGRVSQVGDDLDLQKRITSIDATPSGEIFAVRTNGQLIRTFEQRLVVQDVNRHDAGLKDIEMINSTFGVIGSKTSTAALFVRQPSTGTFELFDGRRQQTIRGVSAINTSTNIGVSGSGVVYKISPNVVKEQQSSARFFAKSIIGRIDLDGDGETELLFKGSNNGNILRIDDGERRTEVSVNDANFQVSKIGSSVGDIDNDRQLELAFVDGNQRLRVVNLDTDRSISLDVTPTPKKRHVSVLDVDDDRVAEIVYISKNKGLRVVDIVEDENRALADGEYHTAA